MVRDVVFFFFKQKTAYEMRISDWSSDVCSSDLLDDLDLGHRRAQIIVEPVLVGEGLFVREQHAFVGDRDDIVVERARRDRLLGLLRKQRPCGIDTVARSDEHTSELQSLMRMSYAVFCLKKKITRPPNTHPQLHNTIH